MNKLFRRIGDHFRIRLVAGLLVILPLGATYLVLRFLFDLIDEPIGALVTSISGINVPGAGIISFIIVLYLAGLLGRHLIGRNIINMGNRFIDFIPFVRTVYKIARNTIESLASTNFNERFTRVVLLEFPKVGVRSIGFVTSQYSDEMNNDMVSVYIPTSPVPTSGFLALVSKSDVTATDLSVEDAMKMVISGGVLTPSNIIGYQENSKEQS